MFRPYFSLVTLYALGLSVAMLIASHREILVSYRQIFAEKEIKITEIMTIAEKINLINKKGFIAYE